jgi:hypothetical protein
VRGGRKEVPKRVPSWKVAAGKVNPNSELSKYAKIKAGDLQGVGEGANLDAQAMDIATKLTTGKNLEKLRGMAHDSTVYRALDRYFAKHNIPETIYNRVANIVFKKINHQGVAEGSLNEFAPDGFFGGDEGGGKGPKAKAKAQMIKVYGPGIITFRKTSNGGYFIQHEDNFGDTNSHQYDPQTGKVDFSGVTRSSYYGEGVAEDNDKLNPRPTVLPQRKEVILFIEGKEVAVYDNLSDAVRDARRLAIESPKYSIVLKRDVCTRTNLARIQEGQSLGDRS